MFKSNRKMREKGNEIDKVIHKIDAITQNEIDNLLVRIDSELNSCGRELTSSTRTLSQIKPLIDRLVEQVGLNAPDHVQVLVQSIAQEVMSKVLGAIDNLNEVQKNIKDVDKLTDEIDEKTDDIDRLTDTIDALTDKFQA
ncbi:hypothetical protein ACFX4N_24025 [Priestia sp. YIM B13551]|uniref:hypothetical protein n=1 Tax=Priestia sp. YIM B13551 TaxID=3366306 RepID=UPI00367267CA